MATAAVGSAQAQLSPGDMNCDGVADGLDVAPFVDCLLIGNCPPCGSCCHGDGTCTGTTQAACAGTWTLGGTCNPNPCARCCFTNGTCAILTQTECIAQNGCSEGEGTHCSPNPCINRNSNPACGSFVDLPSVSGDNGAETTGLSSPGTETWYRVQLREDNIGSNIPVSALIALQPEPNNNYDLFLYCPASCGGSPIGSSGNGTGQADNVMIGRDDVSGDASYYILIEVRWISGACGGYDLTVYGHINTTVRCNP